MKKVYKIKNLNCASCVSSVEKACELVKNLESYSIDLIEKKLVVNYKSAEDLVLLEKRIKKAGFKLRPFSKNEKNIFNLIKLILTVVLGMSLFIIAMAPMFKIKLIPLFNVELNWFNNGLLQFSLALSIALINYDKYTDGFLFLFKLKPNMNSLISISTFSAFVYSVIILFVIKSGNFYFESVGVVLCFVSGGKFLESRAKLKTKKATNDLNKLIPDEAILFPNNEKVLVEKLKAGDTLKVLPGSIIPLDGEVIDGCSLVDEAIMTGESKPVFKEKNAKVLGGSVNIDGVLIVKVVKIKSEGFVADMISLIEKSEQEKPHIQRLADKVSSIFVPVVILVALIGFGVWYLTTRDLAKALNIFASVLTIACPCVLGLATPTAVITTIGVAAKHKILIRNADVFEKVYKVKAIVFDKTGTLTEGKFQVEKIIGDEKYFSILYSLESLSNHPVTSAILNYREENVLKVKNFKTHLGLGLEGEIDGNKYFAGNKTLMKNLGIDVTESNYTTIYLSDKKSILLTVLLKDALKSSAKYTVASLKNLGYKTYILTGDVKNQSERIANELEITKLYSELLPSEKVEMIKKINKTMPTLMIGDGINDAPSLAASFVSASVNTGTDIAKNASDVVFLNSDLNVVMSFLSLSRKALRIIKMNLFWAFFYNVFGIVIALGALIPLGVILTPVISSLLMAFSSVSVVLNALRINLFKKKNGVKKIQVFK